ncbi:MAG: NAD(P)H-binding protein [Moraxellaceae bacterium]|nr:NAD(P)H-binding protein [Moraxellaceae bacterium]
MGKTAVLIGATGLVGGHCLQTLLASPAYSRVIAVTRRPVPVRHDKLERIETPFDQLEQALAGVQAEDAFCCLGTTIRQAGTKAEFHKVDYGYAYEFAHRMQQNGSQHFLLVSALGAHASSPVFYNRVKGLLEKDVAALGFAGLSIFRPSFLVGDRAETRAGEAIGIRLSSLLTPLLRGPLRQIHPVKGADVAAAMVAAATGTPHQGTQIYRYDEMQALLA